MVEAGKLEIFGYLNIENVKRGLSEMKQGLDEAKASAKSAFGDIERLSVPLDDIALSLAGIGAGIATSFLAVAGLSPAVAPALAKIDTSFKELIRTVGEELQPIFDDFAVGFQEFVTWMGSDEGRGAISLIVGAFESLKDILDSVFSSAQTTWKELEKFNTNITTSLGIDFSGIDFSGMDLGGLGGSLAEGVGNVLSSPFDSLGGVTRGMNKVMRGDISGFGDMAWGGTNAITFGGAANADAVLQWIMNAALQAVNVQNDTTSNAMQTANIVGGT